jgi:U6 snRNA-associated Sm-like protein LSm1
MFQPFTEIRRPSWVGLTAARRRVSSCARVPLPLPQIIRAENVVLVGRLDDDEAEAGPRAGPAGEGGAAAAVPGPPGLQRVTPAAIKEALKGEKELSKLKSTIRSRFDFLDGE